MQLIFFANEDQAASNNKKQITHAESITERRSKLGLDIKMILYILEIVLSLTVLIITLVKLPEDSLNTTIEKRLTGRGLEIFYLNVFLKSSMFTITMAMNHPFW